MDDVAQLGGGFLIVFALVHYVCYKGLNTHGDDLEI